jgi:hypothetical protein
MLSFLSPLFLAGAVAAAVPIVLHLLRREPEARVRFAAVKLLKEAPVEHTQKRHLRELILLALRIAALVLLALAFARPFFASGAAVSSAGITVVVLDTSYSMSAPGRFERARLLAKEAIANAPAGDLVGVVTFDDDAQVAVKAGGDRVLAVSAIDHAVPTFGATRYRAGLAAAAQLLGGHRGTLVVVTDLQENGWDAGDRAVVPEGTTIAVADVGALAANLAVTRVRAQTDRIVATVHNGGSSARDARVHLTIDDRAAGDATVSVAPHQSAEATFAVPVRGGVAAVRVEDPEGIAADNTRYAVLGDTSRPSVLVVTGSGDVTRDAFYVQHALAAGTQGDAPFQAVNVSGAQLSSWTSDRMAAQTAVFVLSTRGLERRGRELLGDYAQAGGGLLIAAGADVDGDIIADVLGPGSTLRIVTVDGTRPGVRRLAPADVRHPIFHAFAGNATTLGLVKFTQAARIGGSGCQALARFTTGDTALVECPAGEGRALVIAADLDNKWSDFPLHATFVPFVHEAARYLASARAHASEYLIADAPPGVERVPGVATIADAQRSGATRSSTARSGRIAVNVDARESESTRMSVDEFQSAVTRLKEDAGSEARADARQQEDHQHLWQYAMAVMLVLLAAEGLLAARTA